MKILKLENGNIISDAKVFEKTMSLSSKISLLSKILLGLSEKKIIKL
jgi:hypothetical protein